MSQAEEEGLGLTAFELRRVSAIERALEKIRYHLGDDWSALTTYDLEKLGWLLGELWMDMGFSAWDRLGLDGIDLPIVDNLIQLTDDIRVGAVSCSSGLNRAKHIIENGKQTGNPTSPDRERIPPPESF